MDDLKLDLSITKEIGALGFVTLARQSVVSLSFLLVNNLLFNLGGESVIAVYAIISRLLMFSLFPILGITQGFIPIAAYNYGANYKKRVEEVIRTALIYASGFATFITTNSKLLSEFGLVASLSILSIFILCLLIIPIVYSFLPIPREEHLCLLYTSPSPRDVEESRMPASG